MAEGVEPGPRPGGAPGDAAGPLLLLRGLRKAFGAGAVQALDGADLEVARGEVHALVGENGAGKSTLLNILGGSFAPDRGEMFLSGKPYRPASPASARAAGVALIHQELALAPHLSVEANITLGMESAPFGIVRSPARRIRAILEELGYSRLDTGARAGSLAVAEQQIVEIARALFLDARLILMDEPTSSLPAGDVERLFRVVRALRDRGVSIVYISHFLEEVGAVSDRVTVLRDGRTAAAGLPASAPRGDILRAMAGRPVTEVFPSRRTPRPPGSHAYPAAAAASAPAAALDIHGLVVRPGSPPLSLALGRGQILGIAGLVGSGRSSLLRTLAGLRRAGGGTLETARGKVSAQDLDPERAMELGIGLVSEDRKNEGLALNLSIRANATLASLGRFASRLGLLDLDREADAVRGLCSDLQVRYADVDERVGSLSGGNQQKVALSRLLLGDADIWLLDEPTRGVDVGAKAEIYRLAADWAVRGKAVIWAGSHLPELFGICDTLGVMHRGSLSPVRPAADWTPEAVLAYATSGRQPE